MGALEHAIRSRILRVTFGNECILGERRKGGSYSSSVEYFMQSSGVLLLFVENGAKLPPWLGSCQGKVSDTVVLVSAPDENAARFSTRVAQRVEALSDSDQRIQTGVLVASDFEVGADSLATRLNVAQSVLKHMARYGRGQLLLLTGHNLQPEAQMQLLNLAGALTESLHGTKMTVALRFGAASDLEPPHELTEAAPPSQRRSSRRPSSRSGPMAKTVPPPVDKELVSAVVQTEDTSIESTG
jgi:hypothetical protein